MTERVTFAGHNFPLAADFTAPIAMLLARENPQKARTRRPASPGKIHRHRRHHAHPTLRPEQDRRARHPRIEGFAGDVGADVQSPDRRRADPAQLPTLVYSYPTGYPYPYSAAILRRELDAIESRFPLRKKMVVIGHSMGGCISRLLITDTGDKAWREIFQKAAGRNRDARPKAKSCSPKTLIFRHRRKSDA
jgi:hypothetical protein